MNKPYDAYLFVTKRLVRGRFFANSIHVSPLSHVCVSPQKLQPIGEKSAKLATPIKPMFARRGIARVLRDDVTELARSSSVKMGTPQAPAPNAQ